MKHRPLITELQTGQHYVLDANFTCVLIMVKLLFWLSYI